MYFSIHCVRQVCSPLDRLEAGLGMHFPKQSWLTVFITRQLASTLLWHRQCLEHGRTSTSFCALLMAACCWMDVFSSATEVTVDEVSVEKESMMQKDQG